MQTPDAPINRPRGRGAAANTEQRFSALQVSYDPGEEPTKVVTKFFQDHSTSIISRNNSPDMPFGASLNPYRGCEHGCAYCYARPTHEWLGWSAGVDFESRIMVKMDAPALLRTELARDKYLPESLSLSGVTDCYQPVEKRLEITRGCLAVLAECRHPVTLITKNHLITRDVDHLAELARYQATAVYISITTLDADLARKLEPRASSPSMRLEAIRILAAQGIPVGVSVAPIIPGLNDSEIPAIINAARDAGAQFAGYTVVRLPFSVKEVFALWLEEHYPGMKDKVLNRIEETQGRTLSHPEFGKRLKGVGVWSDQISQVFKLSIKRAGMLHRRSELTTAHFRRPRDTGGQMELW
ncbi:DNA repair photolyase [Prosthecobacter fusiformis]|uniref:DNA repair photolyase n=1 Tax=Prosthecobacter fusiformis TaxID=48464 RepID=A0A4R7S747_9BACT|nr:PA0069 family radical SAM protein [Prosthecobacter fusiformis]TDU73295.1 DNA repair photolyase [Prosthecobacter fusiformis]